MRSLLLFFIAWLMTISSVRSQDSTVRELPKNSQFQVNRFFEFGIDGFAYHGDLSADYERFSPGLHIGLKLNRKKRLNGHISLTVGQVEGQQRDYVFNVDAADEETTPASYFKTLLIAIGYDLQFNIIKKEHFTLYVSQGFGLLRYSPEDQNGNDLRDQTVTRGQDESYGAVSALFPTNVGMIYYFPNNYGVGIQAGLLNPTTDYIDNLSDLSSEDRGDNVLQLKLNLHFPLKNQE